MNKRETIEISSDNIYEVRIKGKRKFIRPYEIVIAFKCNMWTNAENMHDRTVLLKTYAVKDIKLIRTVQKY